MAAIISVKNLKKSFAEGNGRSLEALGRIDLEIESGEFFVLLGPSGSGKSTLLRIMSGLESASSGSVTFAPGLAATDCSFVFQHFALLPWLTVYKNIELGLLARRTSEREREQAVIKELKVFGLEHFRHSYPRELSGGMRQRVGIARALATNPRIIFMDEPFSELDSFTAIELRKELLAIWQERRPTIVMVTHLIQEALELGDRIAVLTNRPGSVEKIIENRLARPREKRSPEFFRLEDELASLIRP